jgi:hypothetical protein
MGGTLFEGLVCSADHNQDIKITSNPPIPSGIRTKVTNAEDVRMRFRQPLSPRLERLTNALGIRPFYDGRIQGFGGHSQVLVHFVINRHAQTVLLRDVRSGKRVGI